MVYNYEFGVETVDWIPKYLINKIKSNQIFFAFLIFVVIRC